ncbi:Ig-like domain-containing protein [Pedobacter sp. KBW06]|uniref:DUF7507 domain-containing protein n=1 Tax=Pedobacter sp. KBW06 TaxID=2153359 RepID=UPI0013153C40|nr:Ig-like domain-containing protein [Pedobacter sp. KBW06]
MKHATKIFHYASLLMCFLFAASFSSYADGSKDLYPKGKRTGGRAFLYSNSYTGSTGSTLASWPFKSLGVHYAYLKAGEKIYAASSAQGVGNGRIRLTAPDGTSTTSDNDAIGRIANRTAENDGPRYDGQTGGNYYTAYTADATQDGIWKIEFLPSGNQNSTATPAVPSVLADDDWTQGSNVELISAWDVSVRNSTNTAWMPGRVYANVLNLHISGTFTEVRGFYGLMHVLTKDGYVYKVDNNGNNGVGFTFFVNNKGFLDNKREPVYKSLDKSTGLGTLVQDPRVEDTQSDITHKIFYTLPGADLPALASGSVPGQETWLKNTRLEPKVEKLGIIGVDGTNGQVSNKGGDIVFDANLSGRYKITISSPLPSTDPNFFVTRTMEGNAVIGTNKIFWNGKDGANVLLPSGSVPAKLVVQLQGAEVHFPYIDMEINPKGIILQLLQADHVGVESDYVYWDDSDVSQTGLSAEKSNPINASQALNPGGTSSTANGHKWGTYSSSGGSNNSGTGSNSFGNEKSMDTWSFILGAEETKNISVEVKQVDLEVSGITPSKTIVAKGDQLSYTVVVKNAGPSDVIGIKDPISGLYDNSGAPFTFKLPPGFTMNSMEFVSACGTEAVPVTFDAVSGLYKSVLKLPSGCEGQYVFKGTVGPAMVAGNMEVWATIMRPNDVTDIDATNPNPNIPPTDPYFECSAYDPLSGLIIPCNNIKKNNTTTLINKITATKEIEGNPVKVKAGDLLTYKIILENTNSTAKTGVTASDALPAGLVGATAISHAGTLTGTTINWTNLTVPANGTLTLSFKTTVGPNSTGITSIKNIASVVDPIDPTTPLTPEVLVPVELISSFTAVKKVTGGLQNNKITAGSEITYSIEVSNTGNTALANLEISDIIPGRMTYVTGTADNAGVLTGSTLKWLVNIPVGGAKTVTFKVKVADDLTGVTAIKNIATITDPAKPLTPSSPEVEVPTDPLRSFTAVKTISAGLQNNKIVAGSTITYNIEVKNTGSTELTGINVSDVIPGNTTYKAGTADNGGILTGNTLNWTINIPFGQTKNLSFQVEVAKDLTGIAAIKNIATVTDPAKPLTPVIPEVEAPTDPLRSFTAVKTISAGLQNNKIVAGSTITYNIEVTNTGSTELTGINVSDVIPGNTTYKTGTADNGGILTGNTLNWTINIPFGQTKNLSFQVEVAKDLTGIAAIKNVATVTDPAKPLTPVIPEVEVPTDPVKSFTATKKITGGLNNNKITAGSTITYSIEVTNTGSTALTNIAVADNLPAHTSYVNGTASPGGSLTGNTLNWLLNLAFGETKTVSFQVKVADDLTGIATIKNVATVTDPTTPGHPPVIPEVEVPTDPVKSFTATKKITGGLNNNKITAGSTITYSIEVTNTGSTALTNIAVADNLPAHTSYVNGTASPGGSLTGNTLNWVLNLAFGETKTVSFQVKVADDLTGIATIKNVATVTDPTTPGHPPVIPEVDVPTDPVKSFTATKKITGGLNNNKITAGSTITYSIEVKNTGSTALTNIAVADNLPAHTSYVNGTASPGGSLTGNTLNWVLNLAFGETKTVSFQVKVADDLTGIATIKNVATVTDPTTPGHPPVIPEVEVPTDPVRSFTATKKISGGLNNNKILAGSTITYSIEVKNTGSTALTNIAIADLIPAHTTYVEGTVDYGGGLTGNTLNWVVDLAFGESKTVSFKVKVADDLTGVATIKNSATVTDPANPLTPVIPEVEAPTDPVKSFTATKKISGGLDNNKIAAGSTITYSIEVKNTGSTALTNVAIADQIPDHTTYVNGTADLGGSLIGNTLNWVVNLAFGQSKTVSFQVKVADNLTGVAAIKNVATVTDPTTPGHPPVIPEVELPTDAKRSFTAVKRVISGLVNGKVPSGAELVYAIDVVNTGGEDLIGLNIADDLPAGTSFVRADQNGSKTGNRVSWTLDVPFGQTKTVLLTLKVADDLTTVETIVNKATVTDPKDPANPKTPEVTVATEQKATISLSKTAIAGDYDKVGKVIGYNLVLKNTGNVAVKDIIITDDNADAGSISPANIASLAPNETVNITAKHTLTQEDLDKGFVSNLAKARGKDPKNKEVYAESKDPSPVPGAPTDPACKDCTVTPTTQKGALSLSKTAATGTHNKVGGLINYNLVLKNTGNVTLKNIIITDNNADAGSISPASIASLGPNETVSITAKHTLTQADLDRGFVSNLAKADGKDPNNKEVHAESKDPSPVPGAPTDPLCKDCTVTPTEQLAGINLVKKITNKGTGEQDAFILNDKIEYTFLIKNTGNTTLNGITLNDPLLGAAAIQIPGSLAPGESVSHKEYYTITAADIAIGKVTNQATVKAKDPKGKDVSAVSGTDAGNNDPTVIPLAKPPVAKDDLAKAEQNKPVKIEVQKNDEPGNSAIIPGSTKIVTQPKNGTLTLNPDGTVTYTPNPGFTGTDGFVYTVTDKNGQISNPATVKIEVTPSKPVAMDDVAETQFNKEIEIPLLHNDKTDGADFEKPTVEIIEQPKNGVLKKNPDGTVVYVPNSGFTGKDSFTYKVKDANGNWTNIATANITIKGFFIPNVITPNGDGKNDEFVIVGLEEFNNAELTIFNRWGNEVYHNGNYRNTWTGEGLNEGTYYYLIRLKKEGKVEVYKGWVLIKR